MDRTEIEAVLAGCELFRGLGKDALRDIAGLCTSKSYQTGEAIFLQGDLGEDLFVIAQGEVFLERSADLGGRRGASVIGILGKGRALGCWSTLLDDAHRLMSSAVCRKPTTMVMLKGPELRRMMTKDSVIGFAILERLCFLLRDRIQGAYGALERV
jgi:CRP-like cAMP-binding protein